ncbi:MAG TPA: FAD-dependent oxidoreductase [Acidimicrobiales bacterium]|nr:FAD-dependent oxidoreductase [Acidimicrobiales bacterium]
MRVIVIGGGIVGASAAYHLATAGADVVLVDRGDEGQATAAGAGIVSPWPLSGADDPMAALGSAAAEHYPRLIGDLVASGVEEPGYEVVGSMLVAEDGPTLTGIHEALSQTYRWEGEWGPGEVERLAPGEPAARFPVLSSDLAGVWTEGTARVDGRVLRDSLIRVASGRGAERRTGTAALAFDGTKVTGAIIDGETIGADSVVVAAGAWSAHLCEPLGVRVPVFPQRGQIVHLDVGAADSAKWPIVTTLDEHYLLAFPDGRVVAGATRESDSGFDYRVTASGLRKVLGDALGIAPGLAGGKIVDVRVGFRPFSPDGLPFVGRVDGVPGLVVAPGLGPIGLTLGPFVGSAVAAVAMDEAAPLDLAPYRPDRRA